MDRLARKLETAKRLVPAPEVSGTGAKVGILGFGTSHWALVEARDQLKAERGLSTDYLRLRAFPFTDAVRQFVAAHDRVYVVEQNRDAQMLAMLRMDHPDLASRMASIRSYNGLPLDARTVTDAIVAAEKAAETAPAQKNGAR
jgi:2-oxoglutarate ferredoxin oxidoreductase subunit alpha